MYKINGMKTNVPKLVILVTSENIWTIFAYFSGLRFCVLKKDVPPEKRRPDKGSTFVPTVRTPEEPSFVPEDLSIPTFPSLLLLIRDNKLEEAKQYIEEGADVNEEDQHGNGAD